MSKKVLQEIFDDSQYSIQEYINHYPGERRDYCNQDKAMVIISSKGKVLYRHTTNVYMLIESNRSVVKIIGDNQFERDYYSEYTNEYQIFNFISGTLLIKAKDRWGNSIEIDITG